MRWAILPCLSVLAVAPLDSAQVKVSRDSCVEVIEDGEIIARYVSEYDASQAAKSPAYFQGQRAHLPWLVVPTIDRSCPRPAPGVICAAHAFVTYSEFRRYDIGATGFDLWIPKAAPKITRNETGDGFIAEIERQTVSSPRLPDLKEERLFRFKRPSAPFAFTVETATSVKPVADKAFGRTEPRGFFPGASRRESHEECFRPGGHITDITYLLPETAATRDWLKAGRPRPLPMRELPWLAIVFTCQHAVAEEKPSPPPGSPPRINLLKAGTYTALLLSHPSNHLSDEVRFIRGIVWIDHLTEATAGFAAQSRHQWLFAEGALRDPAVFREAYREYTDVRLPNGGVLTLADADIDAPRANPQPSAK